MKKSLVKSEAPLFHGKNYTLQKRIIKKGTRYLPQWHDFYEFGIILSGTGEHLYNNFKYIIKPGDAYLMSNRDFHAVLAESDITLICMQFDANVLSNEISYFLGRSDNCFQCQFCKDEMDEILGYFRIIGTEERDEKIYSDVVVKNTITAIVIMTLRKSNCMECGSMPRLVRQVVRYIDKNFKEKISLTNLAQVFSITPNYLGRILTKWLGISFSEYINRVRIKYACNLLATTDLSVKEIAFSSGYNSVEHFIYVFKSIMDDTPSNYRKINISEDKA